jgi:hypothetical protein
VLLHAVLDPDRGERCPCGGLAVVVFVLPIGGAPKRVAWCGERCGACENGRPTAYQKASAWRRKRRWWASHNILGEPTEALDEK